MEALWAGRGGGEGRDGSGDLSWGVAFCDKNMSKVLENANAARRAQHKQRENFSCMPKSRQAKKYLNACMTCRYPGMSKIEIKWFLKGKRKKIYIMQISRL